MKTNNTDNKVFANLDSLLQDLSTTDEATLVGGRRGRGKDDPPGDDNGGHGDDGPGHT